MFLNEHKNGGWWRRDNRWKGLLDSRIGAVPVHVTADRITAVAEEFGPGYERVVRRAPINCRCPDILKQGASFNRVLCLVFLWIARDPGTGRISPRLVLDGLVQWQLIVVIIHIHGPGKLKLTESAHAGNLIRSGLGVPHGSNEKAGQNENDGHDDNQLDQRKGTLSHERKPPH